MTQPSILSGAELVTADTIVERLISDINQAKNRVYLQTMELDDRGSMKGLLSALVHAVERGVMVTVAYDRRINLALRPRIIRRVRKFLEEHGIAVVLLGDTSRSIVAGRSHGKGFVCDNIVYFGGGVNLTERSFKFHDFMFRLDNSYVTEEMMTIFEQSLPDVTKKDSIHKLDEVSSFLVDSGRPRHSLILDTAREMARDTVRIWYISQLAPIARLAKTYRPHHVTYKYNRARSARSMRSKMVIPVDSARSRTSNNYTGKRYIHAKCIIMQRSDGGLVALTGSHNFAAPGIRVGTKEISLFTTDQVICQRLLNYYNSLS